MVLGRTVSSYLQHILDAFISLGCPPRSSEYLRQSILLSAYETPETRQLYNARLKNVAGKIRTDKRWPAIEVPEGVDQVLLTYPSFNTFPRILSHSFRILYASTVGISKTSPTSVSITSPRRYDAPALTISPSLHYVSVLMLVLTPCVDSTDSPQIRRPKL